MHVFEHNNRLIEVVFVAPANDDPVRLECTDLRSEMLFDIHRDVVGQLLLRAFSDRIPLDLIPVVSRIAEEGL